MVRSVFKLKSGNISGGSSFKVMGAVQANPQMAEGGESPAKLWRAGYKVLKWAGKKIFGKKPKYKSRTDEIAKNKYTTTKTNKLDADSKRRIKSTLKETDAYNKSITPKPVKYTTSDLLIDIASGTAAKYWWARGDDGEMMQNVLLDQIEIKEKKNDPTDSTGNVTQGVIGDTSKTTSKVKGDTSKLNIIE